MICDKRYYPKGAWTPVQCHRRAKWLCGRNDTGRCGLHCYDPHAFGRYDDPRPIGKQKPHPKPSAEKTRQAIKEKKK